MAQAMRHLAGQFLRFGGVGVLAAAGHYGTLVGAVEFLGAPAVPATLAGYLVGGAVSYVLNRHWTFASDADHRAAIAKFALVAAVGFALTGLAMALLTGPARLHYLPAQVLTTGIVMLWSFWANRLWTFGGARSAPP
jgi:putative flippase GtrA